MICLYAPVQLCSLFPFLCVSPFAFQMSRFREFTPSVMPSLVHVALLFPVDVHLGTWSLSFVCLFTVSMLFSSLPFTVFLLCFPGSFFPSFMSWALSCMSELRAA